MMPRFHLLRPAVAFVATLSCANLGHAFTGDYAITSLARPPGAYEGSGDVALGNWAANFTTGTAHVGSVVITYDALAPTPLVVLRSTVSFPPTSTLQSATYLSIVIPETGILSFDFGFYYQTFNALGTSGGFTLNGFSILNFIGDPYGNSGHDAHVDLPVTAGDVLSFYATSLVAQLSNDFDSRYGIASVNISNLEFTAAPIPEPAGLAVLSGLAALACVAHRRPRRG